MKRKERTSMYQKQKTYLREIFIGRITEYVSTLSPSHRSHHKPDLQLFKDRARYGYFPGNFPTFSEQRL